MEHFMIKFMDLNLKNVVDNEHLENDQNYNFFNIHQNAYNEKQ